MKNALVEARLLEVEILLLENEIENLQQKISYAERKKFLIAERFDAIFDRNFNEVFK